ncbi:MAG: chromosome segregation protein SMC [Candidatus Woesearchaeota archaeon]|nr:MAG: chromosome segregation protein SMC [Candidatus Woesearchaeota archaeon]
MQPYIEEVSLKGFKSFSKPIKLKFDAGFGVIVGPNGSGKSNILDALCFTLGRLSTKSLRADNYSELISRNMSTDSKVSEVSVSLINDGSFPIESDRLHIRRIILPSGQTRYKLNGKNATRREILDILSRARILPEGHNIILQGDVSRFVDMTALERRRLIEEISGIIIYEERKEKTLRELEKVNEKLKDAQIVLREKENYMDNLKTEKEEAEKYKDTIDSLKQNKFTLINLRLKSKAKEDGTIGKDIEKIDNEIKGLDNKSNSTKEEIQKFKNALSELEDKIEKLGGGKRLALEREIGELKLNLEKSKSLEESSKTGLEKIADRRKQLATNLQEINKKINVEEAKLVELKKGKESILKKETDLKKESGEDKLNELENKIEELENEIEKLKENKLSLQEKIHSIQSEIDKKQYKLDDIQGKLKGKSKTDIGSEKKRYKELVQNIGRRVHEDSKLAVKISDIKKEIIKIEDELSTIRVDDKSREEFVLRDRAIKTITEAKNKGSIKGIHGTVMDLGQTDKEYSLALEVAAGYRVKNIVVDDTETAIACLNLLKSTKSGVATFLPLSKIKSVNPISTPKVEGVIGLAADLIKCNLEYRKIFRHIFRNTIVIRDIETAKRVGIGKYQMVTVDGDVFNVSGAIQGGYRIKGRGLGFKTEDLSGKIEEVAGKLEQLKGERNKAESDREGIEKELENLRKEKALLEGKLESYGEKVDEDWKSEEDTLAKEIEELNGEKNKVESQIKELEQDVKAKNQILISEKNKIKGLRAGGSTEKLNEIGKERIDVESRLAQASSVLENSLLPEKEDISRILKGLEKEKEDFEKQIESERRNREEIKKQLAVKEKEEGSFYSKLKDAFKKKGDVSEKIKEKEKVIDDISKEVSEKNDYKNKVAIKRAKVKAELETLQEEIKEFKNVKEIEKASVSQVRDKIIELEQKMSTFGQVNLKALEKWKELKEEFDNLTWKIGKLDSEKQDIEKVINEIESKKKEVFLDTFEKVNRSFTSVFEKISSYGGSLELEKKRDPFEGGILISIINDKKKRIPIASLSGGEKVLTALALIFAIQELEPAPFYLMDEIDAALDKVNSEKVAKLLKEYSCKAQVIMISHNDSVISEADQLYGVSMSNGISSIVSLKV